MSSTVRISWSREFDNETRWNEVCAWAIEYFGLPGDRFQTHANVNYMDFIFDNSKDALIMALRWNAPIIDDQQLALDFVGSKLGAVF
jgi:hypothetical protein